MGPTQNFQKKRPLSGTMVEPISVGIIKGTMIQWLWVFSKPHTWWHPLVTIPGKYSRWLYITGDKNLLSGSSN